MNRSASQFVAKARRSVQCIRGIDHAIYEWGESGRPLAFWLHGWGDSGATCEFVAQHLSRDWHLIAFDWRGFGRTESRADSYWFPDYLADLDELLRCFSPQDPVRLIGHSMGGNVAGLFAGARPERVAVFVNVEGFGLPDSEPDDAPPRYRRWLDAQREGSAYREYDDFTQLAVRVRNSSPRLSVQQAEFVARQWASRRGHRLQVRADPAHKRPNAVLYRRAEAEACWRQITAPTLLVAGSDSELYARVVAAFGPLANWPFANASVLEIADAGHMIHFEQPRRLARSIDDFLQQSL